MDDITSIFQDQALQKNKEKEFYEKPFNFSYSSMSKLMWNPAVFYTMYVLGLKEEKTDAHLIKGKIIHTLILEEDKFKEYFVISPNNLPKDSPKMIIDRVFNHHAANTKHDTTLFYSLTLNDYQPLILDILKEINLYQTLKTDAQRLEKVIVPESNNYWNIQLVKDTKTVIDQSTYNYCKSATDLIKMKPEIAYLLGLNDTYDSDIEVFNEEYMECSLKDYPFGLKGFVDNIKIDHKKKIIYINDLKTTSKELKDFKESIEYYQYWLQAMIYMTIISTKLVHLVDDGYDVRFHFIVIDSNFLSYAFPVSKNTFDEWEKRAFESFDIAKYHYTERRYELPYHFDRGTVTL